MCNLTIIMKSLIPIIVLVVLLVPVLVFSQQPKDCKEDLDCPQNQFCNKTIGLCQSRQDLQSSPGSAIIVPPTETARPTSTQQTTTIPTGQGCTDSDGGLDYLINGTVKSGGATYTDFCKPASTILNEYYCENNILKSQEYDCSTIDRRCRKGSCVFPKIESIVLKTYEKLFGPKVDTPIGPIGNNRPREANPDNGVLSDLDPWECKITFEETTSMSSLDFSIKDLRTEQILFSGKANCDEYFDCTGLVPPQSINRTWDITRQVSCVASLDNKNYESEPISVARILFIHTPALDLDGRDIDNLYSQFEFFLERSFLEKGDYKFIQRYSNECPKARFNEDYFTRIKFGETIRTMTNIENTHIEVWGSECAKSLGELWTDDDTIIYSLPKSQSTRTTTVGGLAGYFVIGIFNPVIETLAHELGHRYGSLADEYEYTKYENSLRRHEYFTPNYYPTCCKDYNNSNNPNPYYTLVDPLTVACDENIGGRCVEDRIYCDNPKETDKIAFQNNDCITRAPPNKICCANVVKIGNNCYPPSTEIDNYNNYVGGLCAGTPLDADGSEALVDKTIPVRIKWPKLDINSKYRSVMGSFYHLREGNRYDKYIIYPRGARFELPWPLRPGVPKAA